MVHEIQNAAVKRRDYLAVIFHKIKQPGKISVNTTLHTIPAARCRPAISGAGCVSLARLSAFPRLFLEVSAVVVIGTDCTPFCGTCFRTGRLHTRTNRNKHRKGEHKVRALSRCDVPAGTNLVFALVCNRPVFLRNPLAETAVYKVYCGVKPQSLAPYTGPPLGVPTAQKETNHENRNPS